MEKQKFKAQFGAGAIDKASAKIIAREWAKNRARNLNQKAQAAGWSSASAFLGAVNAGEADFPQCPAGYRRGRGRPKKEAANK